VLLLILQVRLGKDELPLVRGAAGATTYENYRKSLMAAADWQLIDATHSDDLGSSGLQIIASKRGPTLDGVSLGLERLFGEVPVGEIVAVSLQVLHEPEPVHQGAFLIGAAKCSMCRYPDGLHAADCPRAGRTAETGRAVV
jgi:hypothetical protein